MGNEHEIVGNRKPAGRGRSARCVFANPERLDSLQRGMRCSLSQRERAGVRGKETQPTKTAGGILHAQLHRCPDSELTITSSAKLSDRGSASGRKVANYRLLHSRDEFPLTPALSIRW